MHTAISLSVFAAIAWVEWQHHNPNLKHNEGCTLSCLTATFPAGTALFIEEHHKVNLLIF